MRALSFRLLTLLFWLLSLLPLRILYVFSSLSYYLVYYVIKYRKKVVSGNILSSFPEKTEDALIALEKKFYRHFCDVMFESIKLLHISDKQMQKRFVFTNIEEFEQILKRGKHCFVMLGHYGNWEWVTSLALWLPHDVALAQVYRPMTFTPADRFFKKLRGRFGTKGIPKSDTLREVLQMNKEKRQIVLGLIADQTPSVSSIHYWTTFMSQNTPCLTGTEKIAQKIDADVVYLRVVQVKRGYYEATFEVITLDAPHEPEYKITETYMRLLELNLERNPALWLWSHKRWKHKTKFYDSKTGRSRRP